MADPKTGALAQPEDFQTPRDPGTPIKPTEQVGYVKTPRDLAIEEMAKRAQARREQADGSFKVDTLNEDGSITTSPEVQAAVDTEQQALPEAPQSRIPATEQDVALAAAQEQHIDQAAGAPPSSPSAPSTEAPLTAPEEERELIVDGKRIRVPLSKILDAGTRTLQKEVTADMRLAAATELLRTAQERQAQQPAPVQPPQVSPSDEDAILARQIQFGTEEEARTAIAKLRNAAPQITPDQIAALVQQKLAQTLPEHQAFNEANAWLRTEHPEIVNDPDLKAMFDMKEEQARKAGDRRPYKEFYADLAGQLTTKFNLRKPDPIVAPQPFQATQASDRVVRKATSPRPVTGASGRIEQAPAAPKALTVTDYVQRQRQLRGLQPLSNGQGI
jgi:hypothetical protein